MHLHVLFGDPCCVAKRQCAVLDCANHIPESIVNILAFNIGFTTHTQEESVSVVVVDGGMDTWVLHATCRMGSELSVVNSWQGGQHTAHERDDECVWCLA